MSTSYHAMVAYLRALIVVSMWMTLLGVGVSRCYILYDSYSQFTLQRSEEAWLRERCREPEFYTNMRQHTDLCAQVERRARQWALLHSLNIMFTTARLCGPRTCMEYANDLVVRGIAWPIALVIGIFVMTVPSIITRYPLTGSCFCVCTFQGGSAFFRCHIDWVSDKRCVHCIDHAFEYVTHTLQDCQQERMEVT